MYCRHCGFQVDSLDRTCPHCFKFPLTGKNFCNECGANTTQSHGTCENCQKELKFAYINQPNKNSNNIDELDALAIWKNEKPNKARSVLHYTIAGLVIVGIIYILCILINLIFYLTI